MVSIRRIVGRAVRAVRSQAGAAPVPTPSPEPLPPGVRDVPMADLAALLPPGHGDRAREVALWQRFRSYVHPDLYSAQFEPADLEELGGPFDIDRAVTHYLTRGARDGRRVCALFNPAWYADRLAERGLEVPDGVVPFLHWLTVGWDERIVPTPLFDEVHYRERHPALTPLWHFNHYLTRGCYQPQWQPSPAGRHHPGGEDPAALEEQRPLLLREMLRQAEKYDLSRTSRLEEDVEVVLRRYAGLGSPRMRALVDKASAIEPLVDTGRPVSNAVSCPPHRHRLLYLMQQAEILRHELTRRLGRPHADTVLVAHGPREGQAVGADPLTGRLLRTVGQGESRLVLTTGPHGRDGTVEGAPVVSLAPYLAGLEEEQAVDLLLDVVRGLSARRIVVCDSGLGWPLLIAYGRQLAAQASLGACIPEAGTGGAGHLAGPTAREFEECFAHLDWVLTGDEGIRGELAERYLLPSTSRDRLVVMATSADEEQETAAQLSRAPRRRG